MKTVIAILSCVMLSASATAATLNAQEVAGLKAEITSMYSAFERGDAKALLSKTHPATYVVRGRKEAYDQEVQQAVEKLLASGLRFVSSELGAPTQTYMAGDEEVCFVPRVSVMEMQGKKAKSTGFMIAIRKLSTKEWKYLDGAGFQKNPELLYVLLPNLERGIELPPVNMELL